MSGIRLPCALKIEKDLKSLAYDGIIVIVTSDLEAPNYDELFKEYFVSSAKIDKAVNSEVTVFPCDLPAGRIISAPTGPLSNDYADVRSFSDAAKKGILRALKAGVKAPLLLLPSHPSFRQSELVTLLGALEALYVNLQVREDLPDKAQKIKVLGVYSADSNNLARIVELATALESGRSVARDIGGADPERMAPRKVEEYIREVFKNTDIKIEVISDLALLKEEYPLFVAVDRAARNIERHHGRIVYLTYEPSSGSVDKTLYLVGKGVTYDTGGADIKAGGVMAGMSRDKCGAAAVAGFMQVLSVLKPRGIKVVGALPLVRNSVGEDSYVADEVIISRNKLRVRIGNTDAEGRMILGDVLCKMRELAEKAINPHLVTIATLTGHAVLTVGTGYSIVMDNGPARKSLHAQQLQAAGEELGDMVEISTIRKEDIAFHRVCSSSAGVLVLFQNSGDSDGTGKGMGDDVFQANNLPSTRTPRGHQGPAGFLMLVSGLDKHGSESKTPLKYSHLDIAASGGDLPNDATGAPILGLAGLYLKDRY
ncbi:putative aminopeptidase W07G4.4 [Cryptotermes secundus]|uniref:Putative aminopeptidase W07G4.4 n=1 Tax=Cryptotermes secundus TaxID=105785 RepID=A0A2J7Q7P0_9NEOP|nr:putative aminopeptidase W07G4.4 isoform X2 [Cryptotermes secundus]PNF24595.1 putative aminopeptidase W07G4.4 [Cryptotermes secundus]